MKKCANGHIVNDDNLLFCPECGLSLIEVRNHSRWCCECGTENDKRSKYCKGCGKPRPFEEERGSDKGRAAKWIIITLSAFLVIAIGVIIFILSNPNSIEQKNNEFPIEAKQQNSYYSEEEIYLQAKNFYEKGLYLEAKQCYMKIYNYKDSFSQIRKIQQVYDNKLSAACWQTVALGKNDAVLVTYHPNDESKYDTNWHNISAISAGWGHIVGLQTNGIVVANDKYDSPYHMTDVAGWNNILAVSAGRVHTVGLLSDGSAVVAGNNDYGQCDLSNWNNLVAICSNGYDYTVGLRSDGTVLNTYTNLYQQFDTSSWSDIVSIAAGGTHIVGLRSDGTVVAIGVKPTYIDEGDTIVVNVMSMNQEGACNTAAWTDIVAIAAGQDFTLGLKADGTVVAVGDNTYGQCNVRNWKDIVAISAGYQHSVGLKKDGTLIAIGNNEHGQCNVNSWKLWD